MEKDLHTEDDIPGLEREAKFSVPEGYFEALPTRIMDRIDAQPARPAVMWWRSLRVWRVALPGLAALVLGVIVLLPPAGPDDDVAWLAEASDEALVDYLDATLDADDILYYDLAYADEIEAVADGLWLDDYAVEDYLDEISLEDLEDLNYDDLLYDEGYTD